MSDRNLPLKFALGVALPVAACLAALFTSGLQLGIDISGGDSLTFAIRTYKGEIDRLQAELDKAQQTLKTAKGEDEKKLKERIGRIEAELKSLRSQRVEQDITERVARILKKRLDPQGLSSLEIRPLTHNRIQIRIPAPGEEVQVLRQAYRQARQRLERRNIEPSRLRAIQRAADQEERNRLIDQLPLKDPKLRETLHALAEAWQRQQAAYTTQAQARLAWQEADNAGQDRQVVENLRKAYSKAASQWRDAREDYARQQEAVGAYRVELRHLDTVLALYMTQSESEAMQKANKEQWEARKKAFADRLRELRKAHPARADDIDAVVEAYKAYAKKRQRISDPDTVKRMVATAGVLEFRIAPQDPENYPTRSLLGDRLEEYRAAVREFEEHGPQRARRRNAALQWFPIHGGNERVGARLVTREHQGQRYVLLFDEPDKTMLFERSRAGGEGWSLTSAYPTSDQMGRPAVGFEFDEGGGQRMARLTSKFENHPMAILLDDEVYSAPYIRATIRDRGIIEGSFTPQEVNELVRTLQSGSLPARVNPEPVSQRSFGPAIGRVNKERGITAAYWGLIAVAVFMLGYYMLAGAIANAALVLNIILVLGAMSMFNAVFTLPGIAGIILTIGIAVDANVLIFERLREEQAKGQSVAMAIKNAYERAFSAIFDANLTTLITCLILGWVGTEEVRGFAITLGLGVMFSMFTALLVTRWIFQALLKLRLLKRPVFMLRLIGTPKINWMRKRYVFWTLSAGFLVLGIGSLIWQGGKIWGIEFSGGTQAVITFRDGALLDGEVPNDARVQQRLRRIANARSLETFEAKLRVERGTGSDRYRQFLDRYDTDGDGKVTKAEWTTFWKQFEATLQVERRINPDRYRQFLDRYDADGDGQVTKAEWTTFWKQQDLTADQRTDALAYFDQPEVDTNADGVLTATEIRDLPAHEYQVTTTEADATAIREAIRLEFGALLAERKQIEYELVKGGRSERLDTRLDASGVTKVEAKPGSEYADLLDRYNTGVLTVIRTAEPTTPSQVHDLIVDMQSKPDFTDAQYEFEVAGLAKAEDADGYRTLAVFWRPEAELAGADEEFREGVLALLDAALRQTGTMELENFDATIAGEAAQLAIVAVVLSWLAIVAYLWLRFGSAQWGLAAVVCLVHDVVIVVGLVAVSGWLSETFVGRLLGVADFKIDLTMIAAILTVVGYSVNDTIVVFDRIRENRGRLKTITPEVINNSINQVLSRTLLTSGTTFLVVFIMYVWGGPGIHAFNYALLAGILFGTYSSVAVASPLLLGLRRAMVVQTAPSVKD